MSKASDLFELQIAYFINKIPYLKASRPNVAVSYSDVYVEYLDSPNTSWVEVKMSHTDNLGNPRVYYQDSEWKTNYSTPIAKAGIDLLNSTDSAQDFLSDLKKFVGSDDISIPTTKGGLKLINSIPLNVMKEFLNGRNQYIAEVENIDLTEFVRLHYLEEKAEPAHYLQAGDDFYRLGENTLGVIDSVPDIKGTGHLKARVSARSNFYEVNIEMKMKEMEKSNFSVLEYTDKDSPWKGL